MLIDVLKEIVGTGNWTTDGSELEMHLTEWRDSVCGRTLIMVSPGSTAEVARVVSACHKAKIALVPQGGNTGLCGGAIPDASGEQVLLSMSKMNAIRNIDADDFSMTVEAGCVLADIQKAAEEHHRLFALSLAAEGSCQIGGNLSTNAGGINVLRYGTARDQVLGLEVVLPDGQIWNGLRSLRKNTAGYDLKHLFIGSEGTLGVITAATLRLFPQPGELVTAMVALESSDQAVQLLSQLRGALGDRIHAFELISSRAMRFVARHVQNVRSPFENPSPWYALIDVAAAGSEGIFEKILAEAFEQGLGADAVVAKNFSEVEDLWRIRHSISAAQKFEGTSLKHDVSVPVGRIAEFLRKGDELLDAKWPEARLVAFGHVGDGNLHYNVSRPKNCSDEDFRHDAVELSAAIYALVVDLGGSISAEHGIGTLKKELFHQYAEPVELELMRKVKSALDPQNLLNPGKVI